MAKVHERIFAGVAVLVVLLSAGALSGAFIIQEIMSKQAQDSQATANSTLDQSALSCADSGTEPTFDVPAKFMASGTVTKLVTTDLKLGTGPAAKANDCLIVKYYGTLAADGSMFDENYTKPEAFAFRLDQGEVIQGWDQGLVGMKIGGERRLVIPAELGYGAQGSGLIPGNSALVFDVRLLSIQK